MNIVKLQNWHHFSPALGMARRKYFLQSLNGVNSEAFLVEINSQHDAIRVTEVFVDISSFRTSIY